MTTSANKAYRPVEAIDEMATALAAGQARVNAFYAKGRRTLIDAIPTEELMAWDGSSERSLVFDDGGLDVPDTIHHDIAA